MKFLKVPGEFLKLCGMGDQDRVFPVIRVRALFNTFVTVDNDGNPWVVNMEKRGAEFVSEMPAK